MIRATPNDRRVAMNRRRVIETMGKTVMKGSAGKMVERNELPPMQTRHCKVDEAGQLVAITIVPPPPPPPEPPKPSASILLIRKAKELSDAGKSLPLIACEMGKDEAWVHASLLIANKLPEKAHQAISDGKFSRTAALQLLLANKEKINAIIDGALQIAEVEGKL